MKNKLGSKKTLEDEKEAIDKKNLRFREFEY